MDHFGEDWVIGIQSLGGYGNIDLAWFKINLRPVARLPVPFNLLIFEVRADISSGCSARLGPITDYEENLQRPASSGVNKKYRLGILAKQIR